MEMIEVEKLEKKYLDKVFHFLKYIEDELLASFQSGKKIEDDWKEFWGAKEGGISSFSTGFERVIYNYFNSKSISGEVNSSPVASDLFFETKDAFIHIDVKTVQTRNIGDISNSIFIGLNQNSYEAIMKTRNGERKYTPAIPKIYSNGKISLSYFLTILYDDKTLEILNINFISMPNGLLEPHYKSRPLKAGKLKTEARFNFKEVSRFEILTNQPSRIKVVYLAPNISEEHKKKLKLFFEL
ncbi:hypothetical protein ThvES_00000430 [Thiovulum sp. ES]|nr:hypothetical protein ThvES_00000430 [Thiovulum sp. ES]